MKIRSDFVTNSSSSSFILSFNSKNEAIEYFKKKKTDDEIFVRIFDDVKKIPQITYEEAIAFAKEEFEHDAFYILMCKPYKGYRSFTDYLEKTTNSKPCTYELFDMPEFIEAKESIISEKIEEFKDAIKDSKYLIKLEYEDHTETGSMLEHEIIPYLDCTVKRFNHH